MKHSKPPKRAPEPADSSSVAAESPPEGLDAIIERVGKRLAKALVDPDASLKQTVALITEVRKLEALRSKQDADLTLARVVAWLRQQPEEERARVERELHGMRRNKGGVLG